MTAVRVFAHSGSGCIAVVAHGGLFFVCSGDNDWNLWKRSCEHSSGLIYCSGDIVTLLYSLAGVGAMEHEAKRDQGETAGESLLMHGKPSCENGITHGCVSMPYVLVLCWPFSLCSVQCPRQCD